MPVPLFLSKAQLAKVNVEIAEFPAKNSTTGTLLCKECGKDWPVKLQRVEDKTHWLWQFCDSNSWKCPNGCNCERRT